MKILSLQIGKPKEIEFRGQTITTGIFKNPLPGPLQLNKLGIDGDGQADLKVHGGFDKALYVYSYDIYPNWQTARPQDQFPFGAFGENVTVDLMKEDQVFIGDTFEVGSAIVQATQPRFPCQKLGVKFNDLTIIKEFKNRGRPGVYFRVLQEGKINTGDTFKLISQENLKVSVLELFWIPFLPQVDQSRLHEILKLKSLPANWQKDINKILDSLT